MDIVKPTDLQLYQHPRMRMMEQSEESSVPLDNPVQRNIGIQGASMSDKHSSFTHKTDFGNIASQQQYSQLPLRKEIDEEGRICAVVLPKTPAQIPTEENDATNNHFLSTEEKDDGLLEVSQEEIKTEKKDDVSNFMETAHDLFLKISSKELTIQQATDLLGRPYSFVYSRYKKFCDNITGKNTTKKEKKETREEENGKKKRRPKKSKAKKSRKRFQCPDCPAIFPTKYLIEVHSKAHLETNESHLCTACGIVFVKLGQLMRHRLKVHDDALQCPHCDKQYTVITSYKWHINTHSDERPFVCDECGKGFFSNVSLEDHYRLHTGEKPFMCGYCEKTFSSISNLNGHRKAVHENTAEASKPKECDQCGKIFKTFKGLRSHQKFHGEKYNKPKNIECQECGRAFKTNYKLKLHMNTHTGTKPNACDLCDARFNLKANLTRHKMIHSGLKPFKCNYCPAAFLRKIDLKRHDMAHTGIKPFKCTECEYSCVKKLSLEYHMNTHTGKTPFKCDFDGCNAEYSGPHTLKQHKLKHCPPPLKTCKVCHEKFSGIKSLKHHMVIHPGYEPLPCDKCDKIFYNESTLKRHMHVHMYKPGGNKPKQVRPRKKNSGIKRTDTYATTHNNFSSGYEVPAVVENGHSSTAQSWTINAETINNQQSFHHAFPASQYTNLNAWPTTMDPDELRNRLLSSFR